MIFVSILSIGIVGKKVHGVEDWMFIHTSGMNQYFRDNRSSRDAYLIFCSTILDVLVLVAFYRFAFYATTYRMALCMIIFYSVKVII
jgi:hypothetical protein